MALVASTAIRASAPMNRTASVTPIPLRTRPPVAGGDDDGGVGATSTLSGLGTVVFEPCGVVTPVAPVVGVDPVDGVVDPPAGGPPRPVTGSERPFVGSNGYQPKRSPSHTSGHA